MFPQRNIHHHLTLNFSGLTQRQHDSDWTCFQLPLIHSVPPSPKVNVRPCLALHSHTGHRFSPGQLPLAQTASVCVCVWVCVCVCVCVFCWPQSLPLPSRQNACFCIRDNQGHVRAGRQLIQGDQRLKWTATSRLSTVWYSGILSHSFLSERLLEARMVTSGLVFWALLLIPVGRNHEYNADDDI